ncbi:MAG TPA: DNA-processing protein DprA [Bryobacteraceae bacterium]|nr:DNA-processing protein DprA [Bryobacteraceae bacterium]
MASCAISQEEELHWLALLMLPGLGTVRSLRLLESFGGPQAIFRASASELEGAGLGSALARSIASGCSFEEAVDQQEKLRELGAQVITLHDPRYPQRLRDIFDPPIVLFARGCVDLLGSYGIAIVGTRRPTPYGVAASERLGADLAQAGLTIISGMARGVDTAAHRAALSVEGATIAVFGCGVDVLYPADNRRLYESIAQRGLLVSEFPIGAPAYPQNFPIRNRIVSGLSLGVIVVEGAQHSGSAITARLASEQSREVFAVPGNITSKMSWAPNLLIKQGTAKLVQEWNDVVNELPADIRRELVNRGQRQLLLDGGIQSDGGEDKGMLAPLQVLSRKVLNYLQVDDPKQLDELLESFEGISSSELIAALFDLEMNGLVRQLPGKNFVKVW